MIEFVRFPHIAHLAWQGSSAPRDDKVLGLDQADALLAGEVVVEEKLDGANLGIAFSASGGLRVQNRGEYLRPPFAGQFQRLPEWLVAHQDGLFDALGGELIAFGEWCAARHSLDYSQLPDWCLLFDVYDRRAKRFWSSARRNAWAGEAGLQVVRQIDRGRFSVAALLRLVDRERSTYRDGPIEGVVVRRESEEWLIDRAKLVRADFSQSITEHWRRQPLRWNRVISMANET